MTVQTEIDHDRRLPKQMRHWFERAGIYQSKRFGLHRRWRRDGWLYASSSKAVFTAGTRDGKRFFRVIPHLDRMDICDGYFDRWAKSLAASVVMPKTEAEFRLALTALVKQSRKRVAETQAA